MHVTEWKSKGKSSIIYVLTVKLIFKEKKNERNQQKIEYKI